MPDMKANHDGDINVPGAEGFAMADVTDPQGRAEFTSAIVAALKELQAKKPPNPKELGQRAYHKLQYDLPLVSPEELDALSGTLRASLGLKSGQPLFPVTAKLLENVVAGARGPASAAPAASTAQSQYAPALAANDNIGPAAAAASAAGVAHVNAGAASSGAPGGSSSDTSGVAATDGGPDGGVASTSGAPEASQQPLPSSLLDVMVLRPDRERLCTSFRGLCAVIFVQLVSHCLAVSEPETWGLLHAVGSGREEDSEVADADVAAASAVEAQKRMAAVAEAAGGADVGASTSSDGSASAAVPVGTSAGFPGGTQHFLERNGGHDSLPPGAANAGVPHAGQGQRPAENCRIYDEPQAAEEDGDDFVFEDLDLDMPCSSGTAAVQAADAMVSSGAGRPGQLTTPLPPPPPPYSWPALRERLVRLAGHVSYALLDEPDLWRDGKLREGVFQLLRALGAHRHAQELQPLLHAYVGLVADRIGSEPSELDCLDSLWDAVGLQCVASLPQVGRQRGPVGSGPGERGGGGGGGSGPLLVEATTCLSLVATLSGQLTGASAKLRLWQQVHRHMLPLLERCLGELARLVRPGPAAGGKQTPTAAMNQHQAVQSREDRDGQGPGPEEVAAIVLVCQVLDFYVQQRPGNADLAAALKGTGVLASLSVLFAAAAPLTGAEPLRSAALCCAATSRELHAWMVAVPGVAKALAGPHFQEGGPHEAHGAVWELLATNGSSPLALSILAGGAAPEKAVRVHALLQLLSRAAACRGGRGGSLWGPAVERAMRELFSALRQEQAGGSGRPTAGVGRGLAGVGGEDAHQVGGADASSDRAVAADVRPEGDGAGGDGVAAVGPGGSTAEEDKDDDDDDDKLHLLDPAALLRRRARQLHPACWRILKQLLTASGESRGKTD